MKIAYITSKYPAVSHTFILNEILAIRRLGIEVGTFSVRQAEKSDILGCIAENEAITTRSLLPLPYNELLRSMGWCITHRFGGLFKVIYNNILKQGGIKEKLKWIAYTIEGILLAYWLDKGQYQHLHCHFGNSGSNTALIATTLARIPFSITCHGSELNDPYGFRLPEKVNKAAFIICISKFGRARLMHVCKRADWPKLHIVRCGMAESKPDVFSMNNDNDSEILCVGRLSSEKGHFILLDAFELMQKRKMKARLILVGDGPLRKELEARAFLLPKPEKVLFTGSLEPEKVSEFFRSCSLVVLASFSEGIPVVLMEAFSHGRPVVATSVGGIPELVENGINGLLVSPGDNEELANAMEKILLNSKLSEKMARNGAMKIKRDFNELISAEKLKQLFETGIHKIENHKD